MNALQQFLQAASNEAAGTISGPVDLIGMGLRKLGVPVPRNALMSSEWMRQNGLMQDVPQNAASLAGQTFGLLSPVVAAAKAPQIARGLLTMGDNAAAPRRLNPQTGAIAWHGSPHKFDQFDSSKIGTGEGAQAYGHGLYLAEAPVVAKEYATKLSSAGLARNTLAQTNGDLDGAIAAATSSVDNYRALIANGGGGDLQRAQSMLNLAQKKLGDLQAMKAGSLDEAGNLYKVDLPDEKIARMLDWDKPLSQQTSIAPMLDALQASPELPAGFGQAIAAARTRKHFDGNDLFAELVKVMPNAQASEVMKRAGFPGIRYLDGGSRSAGAGSSNFVVFPGEENALRILERNGKPIR